MGFAKVHTWQLLESGSWSLRGHDGLQRYPFQLLLAELPPIYVPDTTASAPAPVPHPTDILQWHLWYVSV